MKAATAALVDKIMILQGNGDYDTAKSWIESDGNLNPVLKGDLDRLNQGGIPVDIVFEQGPEFLGLK